jgi:hypothetical protein
MLLSQQEIAEILDGEPLKVPAKTGIKVNDRYSIWAKVGGDMQLITVVCKTAPYRRKLRNGGTAWYVDVFGYGVRQSVNVKKLRELPAKGRE